MVIFLFLKFQKKWQLLHRTFLNFAYFSSISSKWLLRFRMAVIFHTGSVSFICQKVVEQQVAAGKTALRQENWQEPLRAAQSAEGFFSHLNRTAVSTSSSSQSTTMPMTCAVATVHSGFPSNIPAQSAVGCRRRMLVHLTKLHLHFKTIIWALFLYTRGRGLPLSIHKHHPPMSFSQTIADPPSTPHTDPPL